MLTAILRATPVSIRTEIIRRQMGASVVRPQIHPADREILCASKRNVFHNRGERVYREIGTGPLVICVHGWAGRGAQFATLAQTLSANGFRCILLDAGSHGESAKTKFGFDVLRDDLRQLLEHLDEPPYALVGHSAGAMAMMRARGLHNIHADKYVCVSGPFFPHPPLARIGRIPWVNDAVLERIRTHLGRQFQATWAELASGLCYLEERDSSILVAHDTSDKIVPASDADAIRAQWPNSVGCITNGHGHNGILRSPELLSAVTSFLAR